MSEEQKTIQEQQKIIDDMKEAIREIGDFTDGLKAVVVPILEATPEVKIIDLTFKKILELVEQNI